MGKMQPRVFSLPAALRFTSSFFVLLHIHYVRCILLTLTDLSCSCSINSVICHEYNLNVNRKYFSKRNTTVRLNCQDWLIVFLTCDSKIVIFCFWLDVWWMCNDSPNSQNVPSFHPDFNIPRGLTIIMHLELIKYGPMTHAVWSNIYKLHNLLCRW